MRRTEVKSLSFSARSTRRLIHLDTSRPITSFQRQCSSTGTHSAKTGNPNGAGLPNWPKFDAKSRAYMELTNTGAVPSKELRGPVCELYREMFEHKVK